MAAFFYLYNCIFDKSCFIEHYIEKSGMCYLPYNHHLYNFWNQL